MNKALWLILATIFVAGCVGGSEGAQQGRLVVGITDEAVSLQSVSSVVLVVDSVAVHSADTDAWITISDEQQSYDLIQLNQQSSTKLLGETTLDAGTYNQIRLNVMAVEVTANGTTQSAILPSRELKIPVRIEVAENATSAVVLDFQADQSLHTTGEGRIIMAPVIALRSSADANVNVVANGEVSVSGGRDVDSATVGTDTEGNVGVGLNIDPTARLSVGAGGRIVVGLQGQGNTPTEQVATHVVLADDNGFYAESGEAITSITIPSGTKARIRFETTEDVYSGGLDFKSSVFNSPKVSPESSWTSPTFTMDSTFKVTSYWPASNVKKADLQVVAG